MAATESAKARVRSLSAPRQRAAAASTPEREKQGSARKRLSFPDSDPFGAAAGADGGEPLIGSNVSSCCTDSNGDEINIEPVIWGNHK